jgi:oligoribonuclease (3'-5' exoribonuclease)
MARLLAADALVRMHTANGLLAELGVTDRPTETFPGTVLPVADVERQVIGLLDQYGIGKNLLHLAGSGVAAFDRPFLARHMPKLHALLHYAPIDVGVLRRTWQMWTGSDLVTVNQDKTHRAMDDARCHLAEAVAFRKVFAAAAARGLPIRM